VIGSLHLDYLQRPKSHHLEIVGANGKIHWDALAGSLQVYRGSEQLPDTYPLPDDFERDHLFRDQMSHLIAVVRGHQDSRCSLRDGIIAQRLAMAVHASAQNGTMVHL
jgi:predicted dehydrogenase